MSSLFDESDLYESISLRVKGLGEPLYKTRART
jgi:hypothetical protein